MSYNYLTQYNSPNYTPGGEAKSVWGRPRTIEAIAIHWWGDPAKNPSFEGVVSWLCNPSSQSSAHFVATGTGRRVACLVDLFNASWATNAANPYTISIECDPRCRDEDYDVVGELVAELRREYGNIPLVPHKQFSQTACPGNYDLNRINQVAASKNAGADFGTSTNKVTAPPPAPAVPNPEIAFRVYVDGKQVGAYAIELNAYTKWVDTGRRGLIKTAAGTDVTQAIKEKYEPVIVPEPTPLPTNPTKDQLDRIGLQVDALKQEVSALKAVVQSIVAFLTSIFSGFKK